MPSTDHLSGKTLSLKDKVRELLKNKHKLVLVQVQELERLMDDKRRNQNVGYIEQLYNHYIIQGLPKTYIQTH